MVRSRIINYSILILMILSLGSFKKFQQEQPKNTNSLLWEISGKDIVSTSYLYGTIHLICDHDLELPESVVQSLQKSERLALEMDMTSPDFQKEFQKGIIMQDGSNLKKLLSREDFQLVSEFFQDSLGINIQDIGVVKPVFMNSMMYSKLLGCQPKPYELELINIAVREAKSVTGVETLQQQLDIFGKITYKKQAEMLVESIKNFGQTKQVYQDLLNLYKNQDIEGAYELIKNTATGLEDFENVFITERNENWLPVIERMIKEKSTFFAVGAGHLGGENGLIKLLQEKGYKLRPIQYAESFDRGQ